VMLSTPGSAQSPTNQRTIFTFSEAVTIPGHTLPAGKYDFELADTSDRHIIRVFESGGTKLIATVMAIPSYKLDRADRPELRFMETPADMPPAIQTWWYAAETTGHEFIYPKAQARLLAKAGHHTVLAGEEHGELTRINE